MKSNPIIASGEMIADRICAQLPSFCDKVRWKEFILNTINDLAVGVQAEPVAGDYPHEQMDALAISRYKVVPSDQSMFRRHAVVAGDGQQHLYNGSEVDCRNMAQKFAGAFLDGAFAFHERYAAPQVQPINERWTCLTCLSTVKGGHAKLPGGGLCPEIYKETPR